MKSGCLGSPALETNLGSLTVLAHLETSQIVDITRMLPLHVSKRKIALKEISDYKEVPILQDVWKSVTTMPGGLFVMTPDPGITLPPKLPASN